MLAQRQILKLKLNRISIRICGKNEEKKLHFTFKGKSEDGELEEELRNSRNKKKKNVFSSWKKKKNIAVKKKLNTKKK